MAAKLPFDKALRYLQTVQSDDGSFLGQASLDPHDFTSYRTHYTSFFTSLIIISLHDVPGSETIISQAAGFLLKQKSPEWTWNYWLPGSVDDKIRPYPDDLDDTACALAALTLADSEAVDGHAMGSFARQLIGQETAAGGPYTTWLVSKDSASTWRDIDCAVNANIGFALKLHGVSLRGLDSFIASRIHSKDVSSRYYSSDIPSLYFIARYYKGPESPALRRLIAERMRAYTGSTDAVMIALLLSAACYAGISKKKRSLLYNQLLPLANNDHYWPAHALYYEPEVDSQLYYAGSPALTTAFALQAITLHTAKKLPPAVPVGPAVSGVDDSSHLPADAVLRSRYQSIIKKIISADSKNEVSKIATVIAKAGGFEISELTLSHLNYGSINGWAAYSLYDDVLDSEIDTALLGAANVAHRQLLRSFQQALPDTPAFQTLVMRTLDCMDASNTWEVLHARGKVHEGLLSYATLPDYGSNRRHLYERSWGHILAPVGVMGAAGYAIESKEVHRLCAFFRHFITARQLNDDAHDWEEDIQAGRLTAVVSNLLAGYDSQTDAIDLTTRLDALRVQFWTKTIFSVTKDIQDECQRARDVLKSCIFIKDATVLEGWLAQLEQACTEALHERAETLAFIHSYTQVNV